MSGYGDAASWGLIVGVLAPPLTAVVQQPQWTARTRSLVTVLVSVLLGFGTAAANGALDEGADLMATIAAVLVASQASYSQLWKKTGVAAAIEGATSSAAATAAAAGAAVAPGTGRRRRPDPVVPPGEDAAPGP